MYLRSASHLLQSFLFTFFLCNVTVSICTRVTEALGEGMASLLIAFIQAYSSFYYYIIKFHFREPFQRNVPVRLFELDVLRLRSKELMTMDELQ